jgi:hypothetical protein
MNDSIGNQPSASALAPATNESPSSFPAETAPVQADCPKCGGRLISPETMGWCQNCGYCRSLSDQGVVQRPSVASKQVKVATEGAVAFWHMLWVMPRWAWVLLGGVALILGGSVVGDALLPGDSFWRALCSTTQLAVGVFLILGTQLYGVLRVSAQDSNLGGREFFLFSPRLWKLIVKELPATRWLVYLESWGATLLLSAVVIVGNLFYWMQHYQPRSFVDQDLRKAAEAQEKGKELADASASTATPDTGKPNNDVKNDSRPTVQCAIIGYVPDDDGLPTALVLARLNEGKLVYCGTAKRGFLPQEAEELRNLLSKSVRAEPLIKGLQQEAVWVKAGNYCDVHQSGVDSSGSLIDPSFNKLRLK